MKFKLPWRRHEIIFEIELGIDKDTYDAIIKAGLDKTYNDSWMESSCWDCGSYNSDSYWHKSCDECGSLKVTNTHPFTKEELKKAGITEKKRIVKV